MSTSPHYRKKTVSEIRNVAIDMKGKLDAGEHLFGAPAILEENTTDLLFSNQAINIFTLNINGRTVPAGEAVQFRVSGGLVDQRYSIRVTVLTDANPSQTLVENLNLLVEAD